MKSSIKPTPKFNWSWNLVAVIIGVSSIYFAQLFMSDGFNEASNRQAIRMSARISVFLFCMAFGASALHQLSKNPFTWWMRMNRRFLGISFAISHLIHLAFLILLQQNFHPVFNMAKTISLLGGGLAYVFVILMLLTSFPRFSKLLSSKSWTILHTAGGYWIWFIFMRSYFKRALTESEYIAIVVMLVGVLLARIVVRFLLKFK